MQVVLTHIAKHHRTHRHPLTQHGSTYRYGEDVLVEQYNGMVDGDAPSMARELSQQQGGTGWCSVYDVPVLRTLSQARRDGWDPRIPLRKQRAPTATFFAGCSATWDMDQGSLQVATEGCRMTPLEGHGGQWTPQLQAQLFPEEPARTFPQHDRQDPVLHEQVFGMYLSKGDSLLRQLRTACLDLDIPHHTEADLQALMQQFPEATSFESLVQTVRRAAPEALPEAPEEAVPEEAVPEEVAPEEVAPEEVAPEEAAPEEDEEADSSEDEDSGAVKEDPKSSPAVVAAAASIMTA